MFSYLCHHAAITLSNQKKKTKELTVLSKRLIYNYADKENLIYVSHVINTSCSIWMFFKWILHLKMIRKPIISYLANRSLQVREHSKTITWLFNEVKQINCTYFTHSKLNKRKHKKSPTTTTSKETKGGEIIPTINNT